MLQSEHILPATGDALTLERFGGVLVPDKATLDLATVVGREAYYAGIVAAKFSRAANQEDYNVEPVRILDMGSGTGALSIVATLEAMRLGLPIKEVIAFDNDPAAVKSTARNYAQYLGAAGVRYCALLDSWNNDDFWEDAGVFDVIVCNPPFLAKEDAPVIRRGYELVNQAALYVETRREREGLYEYLAAKALNAAHTWSQIHFRLPREADDLARGLVLDSGLSGQPKIKSEANDRLSVLTWKRNHYLKLLNEDPDEVHGQPLHAMSIHRYPEQYPYTCASGDIGLVVSMQRGEIVTDEEYVRLMEMNGYPGPIGDTYSIQYL